MLIPIGKPSGNGFERVQCGYFQSFGLTSLDCYESALLCLRFRIALKPVVARKDFLDSSADSKRCSYFLLQI